MPPALVSRGEGKAADSDSDSDDDDDGDDDQHGKHSASIMKSVAAHKSQTKCDPPSQVKAARSTDPAKLFHAAGSCAKSHAKHKNSHAGQVKRKPKGKACAKHPNGKARANSKIDAPTQTKIDGKARANSKIDAPAWTKIDASAPPTPKTAGKPGARRSKRSKV